MDDTYSINVFSNTFLITIIIFSNEVSGNVALNCWVHFLCLLYMYISKLS